MCFKIGTWITSSVFSLLVLGTFTHVTANTSAENLDNLSNVQALAETRYGNLAADSVSRWRNLLDSSASLPDHEKLNKINKFFNLHVYYDEDKRIWQKADYWATPLETLARARGDCEDFTIAKYVSLRLLDIPANKLKLTYVNLYPVIGDTRTQQAHMVLAYYPDEQSDPLILDNLQGQILPASKRPELKRVFSFNDSTLWVDGQQSDVKPQLRLSNWRDVLSRMRDDGL